MSDTLTLTVTAATSTSGTTDRTDASTTAITITELFRAEVSVPAGAADTALLLNLLTSPTVLIVIGGTGISFKLDSTGTDPVAADPIAIVADDAGLSIDQILLSNSDGQPHVITVIAGE